MPSLHSSSCRMKPKLFLVEVCRIVLGLTLILSAFLKGIDPIGLGIKINEYETTMLGISSPWLSSISNWLAYLFITLEFCTGAFILMGIYRRLSSRIALILIAFFVLITGYSYFSGSIPDCGCFGDALKLTPWETFAKNLVLLPVSMLLVWRANDIGHLYSFREQWLPAWLAFAGISIFIYYNASTLPFVDFRPYKIGYNIREKIRQTDSIYQAELLANTRYVYERNGASQSFSIDSLPDSSWTYKEVIQPESLKNRPLTYSLLILNSDGEDKTDEILNNQEGVILFTSPDWSKAKQNNYQDINELYNYTLNHGVAFYSLSPTKADNEVEWRYQTGAEYPNLVVDATTLKTMIRSNPGLIILKDGRIIDKLSWVDFPKSDEIANFVDSRLNKEIYTSPSYWRITPLLLWAIMLVVGVLRRTLRFTRAVFYLKDKPKEKTNS